MLFRNEPFPVRDRDHEALFSRFARARDGAAAVEFALLAPMMILFLFGAIEIISMLQCNQRVSNSAISIADIISRDTSVSNADMNGLWPAALPLMFPNNATGMNFRVTSISIDSNGAGSVVWSDVCSVNQNGTCGASTYSKLSAGTGVPANDLPADQYAWIEPHSR